MSMGGRKWAHHIKAVKLSQKQVLGLRRVWGASELPALGPRAAQWRQTPGLCRGQDSQGDLPGIQRPQLRQVHQVLQLQHQVSAEVRAAGRAGLRDQSVDFQIYIERTGGEVRPEQGGHTLWYCYQQSVRHEQVSQLIMRSEDTDLYT